MKSALFDQPNRRQSNLVQREKPGIAHGTHTIVVSSVTPRVRKSGAKLGKPSKPKLRRATESSLRPSRGWPQASSWRRHDRTS